MQTIKILEMIGVHKLKIIQRDFLIYNVNMTDFSHNTNDAALNLLR